MVIYLLEACKPELSCGGGPCTSYTACPGTGAARHDKQCLVKRTAARLAGGKGCTAECAAYVLCVQPYLPTSWQHVFPMLDHWVLLAARKIFADRRKALILLQQQLIEQHR